MSKSEKYGSSVFVVSVVTISLLSVMSIFHHATPASGRFDDDSSAETFVYEGPPPVCSACVAEPQEARFAPGELIPDSLVERDTGETLVLGEN